MSEKTIEQVIENHKNEIGAKVLHVSLGPNATPESVEESLRAVQEQINQYNAIPREIRLECEILELRKRLEQIDDIVREHCTMTLDEFRDPKNDKIVKMKSAIYALTDIIPDMHTGEAIRYYEQVKAGTARRPLVP